MTDGAAIDRLLAQEREVLDRVAPGDLAQEVAAGALVVDVRPLEQRLRDGELPGALVIDRNVLEWRLDPSCPHRLPVADAERRIILVCNEGYSSSLAAATLRRLGVARATDLAGGFQALALERGWRTSPAHDPALTAPLAGPATPDRERFAMTVPNDTDAAAPEAWRLVDEGWGRRAADFAALSEPANCREYVTLHHLLAVAEGDRLLDLACGSGLAVELAALRGAHCAGIDASPRLVAVAQDRVPDADLRVGDMQALPWPDDSFEVVTSFRGIWGTTPAALAEAFRVLTPGGRIGFTVWGHIKKSPGAWALEPFRLASQPKVANQAAMVALGRPGVGETLLSQHGFVGIQRVSVPFVWEFADPAAYARALASTGPAYEAIQAVGEDEFVRHAVEVAEARVRDGLPLRAAIDVVGYLAHKPVSPSSSARDADSSASGRGAGFLGAATSTPATEQLFAEDLEELGYVMNASRLWAHLPEQNDALFALMREAVQAAGLTPRQRAVLVTSAVSTLGDSYCALAWGRRLSDAADPALAAGVLTGDDSGLDATEQALATWARRVTADPNATESSDLDALRAAGYDDPQILAITLFVSLRLAFSTVNDSLGARPDRDLAEAVPSAVREAVTWGRPADE